MQAPCKNSLDNDDRSCLFCLAPVVPSWNITITNITSSSLIVKWSNFPLNIPVHRFLVKYSERNSSISLVFQSPTGNNTHRSGSVLKVFRFYEVKVIAETATVGNRTYSSETASTRTDEGGTLQKCIHGIRDSHEKKIMRKCRPWILKRIVEKYQYSPYDLMFIFTIE